METIRETEKKYCSTAMILAIIIALACIAVGLKPVGKGLLLGTLCSAVNFILIGETLPMRMNRSRKEGFGVSLGLILLRYAILAVPLVVSIRSTEFQLISAIIGIFMVQILILADHAAAALTGRIRIFNRG
jgi:hypothetical protein